MGNAQARGFERTANHDRFGSDLRNQAALSLCSQTFSPLSLFYQLFDPLTAFMADLFIEIPAVRLSSFHSTSSAGFLHSHGPLFFFSGSPLIFCHILHLLYFEIIDNLAVQLISAIFRV